MSFTIYDISGDSILVPFIFGFFAVRSNQSRFIRSLWILVIIYVVMEFSHDFISGSTAFLLNYNSAIEFVALIFIMNQVIKETTFKIISTILCLVALIFAILNWGFIQGKVEANSYSLILYNIVLIVLAGYLLLRQIKGDILNFKSSETIFPISVLFYFVGVLFPFGMKRLNDSNPDLFSFHVWNIHVFFNIGYNLLLALTFFYAYRNSRN